MLMCYPRPCHELDFCASRERPFPLSRSKKIRRVKWASEGSMSKRRGRPSGPAPPSAEDLKTPKITQFCRQQPFAPIFQQRMGGGASQGAESQQDPVDLTGGRGESSSQNVTSSSPQTNAPTAAEACNSLQNLLSTYMDSEEEDGGASTEQGPSDPTPNHETAGVHRAQSKADRMEALRREWTFRVREGANSSKYVDVHLDDSLIRKLESIKKRIQSRNKTTDTRFSAEDKDGNEMR